MAFGKTNIRKAGYASLELMIFVGVVVLFGFIILSSLGIIGGQHGGEAHSGIDAAFRVAGL